MNHEDSVIEAAKALSYAFDDGLSWPRGQAWSMPRADPNVPKGQNFIDDVNLVLAAYNEARAKIIETPELKILRDLLCNGKYRVISSGYGEYSIIDESDKRFATAEVMTPEMIEGFYFSGGSV